MFETYAFLVAFAAQILALSMMSGRVLRIVRGQRVKYTAERYPQLYAVDWSGFDRTLWLGRAVNIGAVVLGVLLWGWLYRYTQRPEWRTGVVTALVGAYSMAQILPIVLGSWSSVRFKATLRQLLAPEKRRAMLQPRGLFDFVPRSIVLLTVVCYFLFVAFLFYIQRNPFHGFAGVVVNTGVVSLLYAVMAFTVYRSLYGRKMHPLETHVARALAISLVVKACVYTCLAYVVFISISFTLKMMDTPRWGPFVQCVYCLAAVLFWYLVTIPARDESTTGHAKKVPT